MHGAWGVVLKQATTELLMKCLRQVSRGEDAGVGRDSVGKYRRGAAKFRSTRGAAGLTAPQRAIVSLMTGASNKAIASSLGLNEQTVKNHLRRIFDKLQVADAVNALTAVDEGLVAPHDELSPTHAPS